MKLCDVEVFNHFTYSFPLTSYSPFIKRRLIKSPNNRNQFDFLTFNDTEGKRQGLLFRSLSFLSIIPSIHGQTVLLELLPQPVQIHHEANERLRLSINMQIESSHATLGESLNLISRHFPRVLSPSRFCSLPQRCREWSNPQGRNFYPSSLIKRLERSFPRESSMRIPVRSFRA